MSITKWILAMIPFLLGQGHLFAELSKEALFATPSFISAKVSPDGNRIAYVGADESGIPNVLVGKRGKALSEYEQISFFDTPDIIRFFWSAKSDKVLVLRDENGTGRLHLHGFDISSKKHTVYTEPFPEVNAKVIRISSRQNRAVIGLNHRNPHFHDLYELDLDTGKFTLLFENDLYAKFLVSEELKLILKMKVNDDGSWSVFTAKDDLFMELSAADAFQTEFLSYDEKERAVYLLDSRFSDKNQLVRKSVDNPSEEILLGSSSESDIDEVLFLNGQPHAYASYYREKQWHVIDLSVAKDLSFPRRAGREKF